MSFFAENQLGTRFDLASSDTGNPAAQASSWRTYPEKGVQAVRAHAGMVYGASQRLLGEDDIALDCTRATYLHWLGNNPEVKRPMCGWLHRAAVAQAGSLLTDREDEWGAVQHRIKPDRDNDCLWRRISLVLDEALAALDDDSHSVLVRHFLEGQMLGEIALDDRDSRPAVVHRIDRALKQLRERLKARGVNIPGAALEVQMRKAVTAAPAIVLSELSRLVLGAWANPAVAPRSPAASVQIDFRRVRPAGQRRTLRQLANARRRTKRPTL